MECKWNIDGDIILRSFHDFLQGLVISSSDVAETHRDAAGQDGQDARLQRSCCGSMTLLSHRRKWSHCWVFLMMCDV